jgi:hypothetical protein
VEMCRHFGVWEPALYPTQANIGLEWATAARAQELFGAKRMMLTH